MTGVQRGNEARTGHPWGQGPELFPRKFLVFPLEPSKLLLTRLRPQLLTTHGLLVPQSSSLYSGCGKTHRGQEVAARGFVVTASPWGSSICNSLTLTRAKQGKC